MNFFRKNRTENWIIKLFKITDNKTAEQFDMQSCILSAIDLISQKTELKATDFDINYRSSSKTLNGFKKALKKQKEVVYSFVGFNSDKTNTYFTIDNPMLNWTEKPENSSIEISIQIASEFADLNTIELTIKNLITSFDFEYGYITKLPSNYDSGTERKIKKGLFSTSIEVNETDHVWTFHSVGILDGFIKRLYPVNYLNKSHLSDLTTKELILKYGIIENISDNICKWTLNSEEIESLKNNEQIQKISIITNELGFLKTDKAKLFKDKMELKKPVANTVYKT
ncbi:hypothetical protein [uncultured Aquimarina sp.]|uniref:hypothetical protein n=1 Tax=uncultured Aquimarina sp. TaxID=575652 RepID=UPI00261FC571|nr:hypothetical protein [uncultured Aquimarina sp.]